jgi:hypothetical protein
VETLAPAHAIGEWRTFESTDGDEVDDTLLEEHLAARMPRVHGASRHRIAETIRKEAALAALDPLLVLAVIDVESSYRVHVVSTAGAVGLMQLQLPTIREEVARSRLRSADPHDPVANVQAGVRYLRRLFQAFGRLDVALMAYNAGPTRISGHLRRGGIPDRFHQYPRKVNLELARLRQTFAVAAVTAAARAAVACGAARPAAYRLFAAHTRARPAETLLVAPPAAHRVGVRPAVDLRSNPLHAVSGPGWSGSRGPPPARAGMAAGANAGPRLPDSRSSAPPTAGSQDRGPQEARAAAS